jgi:hypothetical protein
MRVIGNVETMAGERASLIKNFTDCLGFNINPIAVFQPV